MKTFKDISADELEILFEELNELYAALNEERELVENEHLELEIEKSRFNSRLELEKQKHEKEYNNKIQGELESLHADLLTVSSENKRLLASNKELSESNRKFREQVKQLQSDVVEKDSQINELKSSLKNLRERNQMLKERYETKPAEEKIIVKTKKVYIPAEKPESSSQHTQTEHDVYSMTHSLSSLLDFQLKSFRALAEYASHFKFDTPQKMNFVSGYVVDIVDVMDRVREDHRQALLQGLDGSMDFYLNDEFSKRENYTSERLEFFLEMVLGIFRYFACETGQQASAARQRLATTIQRHVIQNIFDGNLSNKNQVLLLLLLLQLQSTQESLKKIIEWLPLTNGTRQALMEYGGMETIQQYQEQCKKFKRELDIIINYISY